ncbi:MAG: sulfotransferase [Halieaceae bacterium]|nr:sulfotransferase [Halieaceae bacterium]
MYFDFHYYRKVLAYAWAQKQWPGRNKVLVKLLILVPLTTIFHAAFFTLDYLFFPALWHQKVVAPVFVVGHARSGTTLMHRLLAADGNRFSYFMFWEMFFPALTEKKIISMLAWLDRTVFGCRVEKYLQDWDERTFGQWRHIHEQGLWIPEEDQFIMNAAFVTQQWALDLPLMHEVDIFHIDELSARRRRSWMNFYKACVKRQLVLKGSSKTHLSKNPVMSGWVGAILDTFPDAAIVVMVRDPLQCIPSTLKLVEQQWRSKGWKKQDYLPSQQALTAISFDSFEMPRDLLAVRPGTPHKFVDYRDLTKSPKETVEQVYSAIGLGITDEYREYLHLQQEKEKKHSSKFNYNIDDYEITPREIEARLASLYDAYQWPRYQD